MDWESSTLPSLVLEYLYHAGCSDAAESFTRFLGEQRNRPAAWQPLSVDARGAVFQEALRALDAGEQPPFLAAWERCIPPAMRRRDRTCIKLEFYVHVYFAVYPVHEINARPDAKGLTQSMERFRGYLESNGAALSGTAEFLAYYALPHVPSIDGHVAFRELLTRQWAAALRARVSDFLRAAPQLAAEPKLVAMHRAVRHIPVAQDHGVRVDPAAAARADIEDLRERLADAELRVVQARQAGAQREVALVSAVQGLYRVVRDHHQRLGGAVPAGMLREAAAQLGRARDTLDALGLDTTSLVPTAADPAGPPVKVAAPHPSLSVHSGSEPAASPGGVGHPLEGAVSPSAPSPAPRPASPPVPEALSYDAVRSALKDKSLGEADRALIIQALRWRLMRSAGRPRELVLLAYTNHDVLGDGVLEAVLDGPPAVVEQAARLLNHVASFAAGRAYLISKSDIVMRLAAVLTAEDRDSPLRQNILGTLQKLSLRRAPQLEMIDRGVIDWLAATLADPEVLLSDYTIDYATALLMNLSLRVAGRRRCERPELRILEVLNLLLEYDSPQVRTYVHGTLYSILSRPILREQALAMGLPHILEVAPRRRAGPSRRASLPRAHARIHPAPAVPARAFGRGERAPDKVHPPAPRRGCPRCRHVRGGRRGSCAGGGRRGGGTRLRRGRGRGHGRL